jgi:molybdopterin synthase catalytic subunit
MRSQTKTEGVLKSLENERSINSRDFVLVFTRYRDMTHNIWDLCCTLNARSNIFILLMMHMLSHIKTGDTCFLILVFMPLSLITNEKDQT